MLRRSPARSLVCRAGQANAHKCERSSEVETSCRQGANAGEPAAMQIDGRRRRFIGLLVIMIVLAGMVV